MIVYLFMFHLNLHIKVGTVAIGADFAYQCSLTLTSRLISQNKCGPQVVGGEIGGESGAATDGSFLKRERVCIKLSVSGATSVHDLCVCMSERLYHIISRCCVCAYL